MISSLSGTILEIHDQELILDCPPFSFSLLVANSLNYQKGKQVQLKTYLHWNQEQGFSLFGFQDNSQKLFFLALLNCSGVGPRLALAILSHASVPVLCAGIKTSDLELFTDISGIGQKKAEQIIVHMKHTLKTLEPKLALEKTNDNSEATIIRDLEQTLLALQYSRTEIYDALKMVKQESTKNAPEAFDTMLRKTLQRLTVQRKTQQ